LTSKKNVKKARASLALHRARPTEFAHGHLALRTFVPPHVAVVHAKGNQATAQIKTEKYKKMYFRRYFQGILNMLPAYAADEAPDVSAHARVALHAGPDMRAAMQTCCLGRMLPELRRWLVHNHHAIRMTSPGRSKICSSRGNCQKEMIAYESTLLFSMGPSLYWSTYRGIWPLRKTVFPICHCPYSLRVDSRLLGCGRGWPRSWLLQWRRHEIAGRIEQA